MPNTFNTALQGAYGRIMAYHNDVRSTNAAIDAAILQNAASGYNRVMAYQDAVQSTNAAIDAASPFGPVASNFAHNPDNLHSTLAKANSGAPLLAGAVAGASEAADVHDEPVSRPPSALSVSNAQLEPQTLDYLNADLAASYGMDRTTAYQEALSNTSYQRAVRDMQAAGLNPAALFGAGKGSGAGGVAYASTGGSSGSSNSGKLFSKSAYNGLATGVGIATALISGSMHNFWIGQTAARGVMSALDGLFG